MEHLLKKFCIVILPQNKNAVNLAAVDFSDGVCYTLEKSEILGSRDRSRVFFLPFSLSQV